VAERFRDRVDAGDRLGSLVAARVGTAADAVVFGLPRGGVVVAARVASRLGAPLDVIVARKVGAPGRPELGIGAVAEGGVVVLDDTSVAAFGLGSDELARRVAAEQREVDVKVRRFRGGRPPTDVAGKTAILVDDGLATGVTARAAVAAVRRLMPARVVLAVPVAPPDAAAEWADLVDELIVVTSPPGFRAVGEFYRDFRSTTDDEVVDLLDLPDR